MRSIILDGTDVTDHVFQPGRVLHGWGAKEDDSFIAHTPSPTFHAAVARAYRLADEDARKRYWPLLRDLFKGAGLGDLGTAPGVKPAFNFATQSPEPGYIFALSGLFAHHPDHLHTFRHNKRTKKPHEGLTVGQTLRRDFDYERPKVVALDVIDQNLKRWFDHAKMETYYEERRGELEEKGYIVGEDWYPN